MGNIGQAGEGSASHPTPLTPETTPSHQHLTKELTEMTAPILLHSQSHGGHLTPSLNSQPLAAAHKIWERTPGHASPTPDAQPEDTSNIEGMWAVKLAPDLSTFMMTWVWITLSRR